MDLYKAENLVMTVDNSGAKRSNTVIFDAPVENVKSIGIRALDPCCQPYWTNSGAGHEVLSALYGNCGNRLFNDCPCRARRGYKIL